MCLPVSRLFCVLSLAYPNLLGIKGYVVVVDSLEHTEKQNVQVHYSCVHVLMQHASCMIVSCYNSRPRVIQ
jgi:hypothetical protein